MLSNESISVKGEVSIVVTDKDGNIKETRDVPNLIVSSGKNHIAARIANLLVGSGQEGYLISHLGFGTSTVVPSLSDTTLFAQLGTRSVVALAHTITTNTVVVTASYVGYTGSLTEAGLFNAATGGTMICRTTFGAVPIIPTDTLAISWTLKIN